MIVIQNQIPHVTIKIRLYVAQLFRVADDSIEVN
jgi:hypothetical protein